MSNSKNTLPQGWIRARLKELGMTGTASVDPSKTPDTVYELWSVPAFPSGEPEYLSGNEIGSTKQALQPGDVLLCKINPRINRVWRVGSKQEHPQIGSSEWIVFRTKHIDPDFLMHRFREEGIRKELCANVSGVGGSLTRARPQIVKDIEASIPPLNEQRRIVAKIEALQAHSRRTLEALEAIPPLLEKFRQSVLAAAFRGDLTAEWRKQHPDIEPASELLAHIREERRCRWEESELAKMRRKGKEPKDDHWKMKYKEPELFETSGLPELPEGWCWSRLGDLSSIEPNAMTDGPFGSNLKTADYVDSGIRVVRLGNIGVGKFIDDDKAFVTEEKYRRLAKHEISGGDLIIAALAEPVGRCCRMPDSIGRAIVKADCVRLKPHQLIRPEMIMHWLNSPGGNAQTEARSHGVGRLRINLGDMRDLPVPILPAAEQNVLVSTIENHLAAIDQLVTFVTHSFDRIDVLNHSILAKAFRGELVPQNPNDEPASVLLERVRREREAQATGRKKTCAHRPRTRKKNDSSSTDADEEPAKSIVEERVARPTKPEAKPSPPAECQIAPRSIEDYSTDEIIAEIRQTMRGRSGTSRDDVLHQLSEQLGFSRLGPKTREVLSGHLLAAQHRHILISEGMFLFLDRATFADYTRDELVGTIISVTRMYCVYDREDIIYNVAYHLGFSRVTEPMRERVKSAINAAIRRGILERNGRDEVRRIG